MQNWQLGPVLQGQGHGRFAAAGGFEVPVSFVYTYTDAKFKTSFVSGYEPWGTVTAGDRLPYIPTHQMTVNAGLTA